MRNLCIILLMLLSMVGLVLWSWLLLMHPSVALVSPPQPQTTAQLFPSLPSETVAPLPTEPIVLLPTEPQVIHDIRAPLDWYIWQGYWYGGMLEAGAEFNCGPAAVSMALRYGSNNALQPTPEEVRDVIPHRRGTQEGTRPHDLTLALNHWNMPWRAINTLAEIEQAIAHNHIVISSVRMKHIRPAADSDPVQVCTTESDCVNVSGRYYDYEGQHALVVKGIVQDSTTGQYYVVVYDPDVWGGNANYYYRGQQYYPKGLNRLYPYEEFVQAFHAQTPRALEILATPWAPLPLPDASDQTSTTTQPDQSASFWCSASATDVTHLFPCHDQR